MQGELMMPLFAALSTAALAVVSLLSGRRELAWKLFAAFGLSLTAPPICMMLARYVFPEYAIYAVRMAPGFALASFASAMLYVAVIGRLKFQQTVLGRMFVFDFEQEPPRVILAGRERTFRWYLSFAGCFWLMALVPVVLTDLVFESIDLFAAGGPAITFGSGVYVLMAMMVIAALKLETFLWHAYRNARTPYLRSFLIFNFIAFGLLYLPALTLNLLLPKLGITNAPLGLLFVPLAVFVFFAGIVRYQFAHIQELNQSLEAKVVERTRALEQAQLRLIQSEKMASIAQLVAGLTHELNNPIGAIRSMVDNANKATARLRAATDSESLNGAGRSLQVLDDAHRVIGDGAHRVAELVSRLRGFSRLDEAQFQEISVESSLDQVVNVLQTELPQDTTVVREYAASGTVHCQPVLLNQLWLNLLSNAHQSLAGPGRIVLRTSTRDDHTCVEVEDNGRGIAEADLARIFDPGFTTKGGRIGAGLGLAISYQIVQDHGGAIQVESQVGQGTKVQVTLPTRQNTSTQTS